VREGAGSATSAVLLLSKTLGIIYLDAFTGEYLAPPLLSNFTPAGAPYTCDFKTFFGGVYLETYGKNMLMLPFPTANNNDGAVVFIDDTTRKVVEQIGGAKGKGYQLGSFPVGQYVGFKNIFYLGDNQNTITFYNPNLTVNYQHRFSSAFTFLNTDYNSVLVCNSIPDT